MNMNLPNPPLDAQSGHSFRQRFDKAQQIVAAYADYLQHAGPMPGQVADASQLPCDKEQIRSALVLCLSCSLDPAASGHLEAGYLLLSAFQHGVGPTPVGELFAELDLEAEPNAINAILQQQKHAAAPWRQRALAELLRLQSDLAHLRAKAPG